MTYNGMKVSRLAYRLHQQFKEEFLAGIKNKGTISAEKIRNWIEENKNK
jgi:hypothetical protein